MLGYGQMTIDSIGDQVAVLDAVPHVQFVQTTLYQLIEGAPEPLDEEDDEEDDEYEEPADRPLGRRR
jgi:hypothetical protein